MQINYVNQFLLSERGVKSLPRACSTPLRFGASPSDEASKEESKEDLLRLAGRINDVIQDPKTAARVLDNLLPKAANTSELDSTVQQLISAIQPFIKDKKRKKALLSVCQLTPSLKVLPALLKLVNDYANGGGNPEILADNFNILSKTYIRHGFSVDWLMNSWGDIGEVIRQYKNPQERDVFETLLQKHPKSYVRWLDALTRLTLMLEREFPEEALRKQVMEMIDIKSPAEQITQGHSIFETIVSHTATQPALRKELIEVARQLYDAKLSPEKIARIMPFLLELPGGFSDAASILSYAYPKRLNLDEHVMPEDWEANMKVLIYAHSPTKLLNHLLLNREQIHPRAISAIYEFVEFYGNPGFKLGMKALPELMALLIPYQEIQQSHRGMKRRTNYNSLASGALTRLYHFTDYTVGGFTVGELDGIGFNNWARIGTLGLSFSKWQFDAMTRWKKQGPMVQMTLLEQSGLFKRIPPRKNDSRYSGGFVYHSPETQLSIEMRRAYLVLSKPGLGSLVIRNSSPVFGRDKLAEPGYYHPNRTYGQANPLFDPDLDLKEPDFKSVLSKELHRDPNSRVQYHENMQALMAEFDGVMQTYTQWKCGFKDGKAPAGFAALLNSALMSGMENGLGSPFGKHKNLRLAWVNPQGLPMPLRVFDSADKANQAEMAFYLQVLGRKQQVSQDEVYRQKMPKLTEFLAEGLSKGWELTLTEAEAQP